MGKSLKVSRPAKPAQQDEDMELLISHSRQRGRAGRSSVRARVKLQLILFAVGLLGSTSCLWAMLYTSHSEEVAQNLGLHRVANSLENVLSLLAYPVLMFTGILTIYATQQLYRLYKEANDPETYRRNRSTR